MQLTNLIRHPGLRSIAAAALVAASLVAFAQAASAALIPYSFTTGTVLPPPGQPADFFSGQTVSGSFIYNNSVGTSSIIASGPFAGSTLYSGNFSNFSAVVGGSSIFAPNGNVIVSDDHLSPVPGVSNDAFLLSSAPGGFTGFSIGAFNLVGAQFGWFEGAAGRPDFLTDQSLPTKLKTFGPSTLTLIFVPVTGGPPTPVSFAAQLTAVPEPATWAMMITGFGLAGVAMRRRKQPSHCHDARLIPRDKTLRAAVALRRNPMRYMLSSIRFFPDLLLMTGNRKRSRSWFPMRTWE